MNKTIIIAEAGVNHNGSIKLAKKFGFEAKNCGADYIKFQTFITEKTIAKNAKKADYQLINTKDNQSQFEMVKKLELTFEQFKSIKKYCDEIELGFLSSGFDPESLDFLKSLDLDFFKIASGEITNKFLLEKIASFNKPTLLSTGMSSPEEIKEAITILKKVLDEDKIIIMHCNTEYPTPMKDVNLKAMEHLKDLYGLEVGFSDHTLGIEIALASVARGACVIEKHFTLDKSFSGPDHKMSLGIDELRNLVVSIRNIEDSLSGTGIKAPSNSEVKNIIHVRKSLYYAKEIIKGQILKKSDLLSLRPGSGVSPMLYENFITKRLKKSVKMHEQLEPNHFEI